MADRAVSKHKSLVATYLQNYQNGYPYYPANVKSLGNNYYATSPATNELAFAKPYYALTVGYLTPNGSKAALQTAATMLQ